MYVYTVLYTCL